MSINKINTYANDDTNILAVQTTADQLIINRTSVSLTNMTDTTLPVVAAGSYFDCGGTLYKVGTDTTPSGTPTDNATCYIMATPAVDGLTATLSFTNTAPTWNDSKQGWYGTAGNAGNVYLHFAISRASTVYRKIRYTFNYDFILGKKLTNQYSNGNAWTAMTFSDFIDANNCFSSDTYTCQNSGLYNISFLVHTTNNDSVYWSKIEKNGSIIQSAKLPGSGDSTNASPIWADYNDYLVPGDSIKVYIKYASSYYISGDDTLPGSYFCIRPITA